MQKRRFRAPLTFDSEKFSRACKVPEKFKISKETIGFILKSLYVFLLLSINMVLFATSGNMALFTHNGMVFYEILLLLFFICLFSVVVIGFFYKCPTLQNIVCALLTYWFVITLFNQFYQSDSKSFIGNFLGSYLGKFTPTFLYTSSVVVLALIITILFIWIAFKASLKIFSIYVFLFLIAFIGIIGHDYSEYKLQHDFIEQNNLQENKPNIKHDNKFIYIMLPNFASYKYFANDDSLLSKSTFNVATGFLAKNKFEIFPNTYAKQDDQFLDVVQLVNTNSNQEPKKHILNTMLLSRYWKFFNTNDEHIFLQNNQLFDSFKQAGYNVSAYKSRGIDICHKNHKFNVDRCVEKINRPVNVYDSGISVISRTQLLFAEWVASMNISNLAPLYRFLKIFSEPEKLPLVGINYNNLYVINSIKTFDVLAENILSDTGRKAYFVYADIPSDMFIYDEFCRIKPREKWVNMDNLPWIADNKNELKYKSYTEQTRCLYGKLQEFVDKLEVANLSDKTVLIISGVGANHNFADTKDTNFSQRFIYDKMVALAIKSPQIKKFTVNNKICTSTDVVNNFLYNANVCDNLSELGFSTSIRNKIVKELKQREIKPNEIKNNINIFNKWYQNWLSLNKNNMNKVDIIKEKTDKKANDTFEYHIPTLKNHNLMQNKEN